MEKVTHDSLLFYRWKIFEPWQDRFTAVLTTRQGGRSEGQLQGLNLGRAAGDTPETLEANRRLVESALDLEGFSWACGKQVHGTLIREACAGDSAIHPDTDGFTVSGTGVIASILLADCHPVVLYDPLRHAAAVCHAGWRGTAAGMAVEAVNRMIGAGSRIGDIRAATGPGIGPCCYQVDRKVKEAFESSFEYPAGVFRDDGPGRWRLDIEAANIERLRRAGLSACNIEAGGFCTACRTGEFYSHRKEKGLTGRHSALVALLP